MISKYRFTLKKNIIINILSVLVLLIAVGSAFFFYNQYQKTTDTHEVETIAAAVAQLYELPGESPTLATVSDVDKLKDQEFFVRAQNGDKVLIFKQAQKAILYRPQTNKIIEVGPVQIDAPHVAGTATISADLSSISSTLSALVQAESAVSVAVYNGTTITGLSRKTADELEREFSNLQVTSTGNAADEYKKTVVIDLTGNHTAMSETIAEFVKGEIGSLPQGETAPDADILIVLGID